MSRVELTPEEWAAVVGREARGEVRVYTFGFKTNPLRWIADLAELDAAGNPVPDPARPAEGAPRRGVFGKRGKDRGQGLMDLRAIRHKWLKQKTEVTKHYE